jgi:hypothetical protein
MFFVQVNGLFKRISFFIKGESAVKIVAINGSGTGAKGVTGQTIEGVRE